VKLIDLGYNEGFEKFRNENNLSHFEIGRVISEHKERYSVKTVNGDFEAEITGNLRFSATSRKDFPAVGDWVALATYDSDFAIIHAILPRYSTIARQAVEKFGELQIIATNIDYAFLVQAIDRDFNPNRLERYLTICNSSGVKAIILLTKIDLIDKLKLTEILEIISKRFESIPVFTVSNISQEGFEDLVKIIEKGKTYCLLGSSGVGKSSLLNNLSGQDLMKTNYISESNNKGRHVTSHRELFLLANGGILIDNPGMREVGIADSSTGLEMTFDTILKLSAICKYSDCTHTSEVGCAVIDAVEKGVLDSDSYANYLKMEREKAFFESSIAERRKKEKQFGKIFKNYKKDMKKGKI